MRYGIGGMCYQDNNGNPLSGGKIFFYETGTDTEKTTYSDEAETIENTNPVLLDAAGRQPDIFFSGEAKVVITTSAGVQIDEADPVGEAATTAAFVAWLTTLTYGVGDLVTDPDGNYFVSLTSANVGNEPATSPTEWMELRFINVYNENFSYAAGDVVLSDEILYVSRVGTNVGNTPATSYDDWRPLNSELAINPTVQTTSFSAAVGARYLVDTSGGAIVMTLPATPTVGDKIGFTDFAGTFLTYNLTIGRNGEEIMGDASNLICNMNNYSGCLYYSGASRGWSLI